ncbi:MAG: hypothetical protein HOC78_01565 [Candidatus Komeilibacteria bacterium]|jgi:hypothetical protein|nr:hypothetical protein [Candidatus Komeilibacteria bacterium]
MNLFKNQKGFSDVITVAILAGVIGAIFIGGVFVWKEVDKTNSINNLYSKLSRIVKVEKEENYPVLETEEDSVSEDVVDNKKYNEYLNRWCLEPTFGYITDDDFKKGLLDNRWTDKELVNNFFDGNELKMLKT